MEALPVILIVKAPNQQIEDQTVKCELSWTINKLKQHLSEVYPSKPAQHEQKLIYSGKLLSDTVILKDVLRQFDGQETHTVHLVCTPKYASNTGTIKKINPNSPTPIPTTNATRSNVTEALQSQNNANTEVRSEHMIHERVPNMQWYNSQQQMIPPNIQNYQQYNMYMMMMQQAYMQYMTQYMTMAQQSAPNNNQQSFAPQSHQLHPANTTSTSSRFSQQTPTIATNNLPPIVPNELRARTNVAGNNVQQQIENNRPQQQQEEPQRAAPAIGGAAGLAQPVLGVDDDAQNQQQQRDWLDMFYMLSRLLIFTSIVYFYSNPIRCVCVVFLAIMLYLYQIGFFGNVNLNNNNILRGNEDVQGAAANQPTRLMVIWTFFTTFFASLIPETPNVI